MRERTRRGTLEDRVNGLNRVVKLVMYEVFILLGEADPEGDKRGRTTRYGCFGERRLDGWKGQVDKAFCSVAG
jgi:hypothetical protein